MATAPIEEKMLIKVSAEANNNKFYHVVLSSDGTTVTKRWGRVGSDGTSAVERTGLVGFDRIVREKTRRGYKPTNIVSANVSVNTTNQEQLAGVAKKFLSKSNDTRISSLIERIVKVNAHQIMATSGGMIKIADNGQIKTALGVVDKNTIQKAGEILTSIQNMNGVERKRILLLEDYLTLIPQKVTSRRGWSEDYLRSENLIKQVDFLDQLKQSYDWAQKTQNSTVSNGIENDSEEYSKLFRMKLDVVSSRSDEYKEIERLFLATRNNNHQSRNHKLINVYSVEDLPEHVEAYEKALKSYGNEQKLWHGTKAANILSILTRGFFVPPMRGGTVQVTGRLFGDGIYLSSASTKSLNYASGFWAGQRNTNNCFMFLNNVVMGNEYRPHRAGDVREAYTGHSHRGPFNSINVKAGTAGVINHESVVWNTEQISTKYLCEFAI